MRIGLRASPALDKKLLQEFSLPGYGYCDKTKNQPKNKGEFRNHGTTCEPVQSTDSIF